MRYRGANRLNGLNESLTNLFGQKSFHRCLDLVPTQRDDDLHRGTGGMGRPSSSLFIQPENRFFEGHGSLTFQTDCKAGSECGKQQEGCGYCSRADDDFTKRFPSLQPPVT